MLPDAALVSRAIDHAVRRARLVVAAEAAAAGAAVAAWSVTAGIAVALAFAVWRARLASRPALVRALERAGPHVDNLLITAEELTAGALVAKPEVHERVVRDAVVAIGSVETRRAVPLRRLVSLLAVASMAWVASGAVHMRRGRIDVVPHRAPGDRALTLPTAALHVRVTIEPPTYTGLSSTTLDDPVELEPVENSRLSFSIQSSGREITVEMNDTTQTLTATSGRPVEYQNVITHSGYVLLAAADGRRRLIAITVKNDALPAVRIVAPGRDLVYASGNPRISFGVEATDDYGLRSLALRFTRVSGSGEQFEFADGEIALVIDKTSAREWHGASTRSLMELGLNEGDMFVYRAVAADARPGDGEASSDAYFIEISKRGVAAGDAFTLPQEETRYALSQQMLIVKTERLNQRRASMNPRAVVEAAQGLAIEQRMIRSEFVFMLGGEIEDEEVEAEQSIELQEGRLANRGQRDLRAATVAMSQAEKLLTDASTVEALKAERAAVVALQRAFARDRYILRALAARSPLDPARRLTGAVSQTIGWRRLLADAPANQRAARLANLLAALGERANAARADTAGPERPAGLSALAALTIRVEPQVPALQRAAADLQRLDDAWTTLTGDERARRLDGVAGRIAQEARLALADAPALGGATR